jgi:hypothetical protein
MMRRNFPPHHFPLIGGCCSAGCFGCSADSARCGCSTGYSGYYSGSARSGYSSDSA